MRKYILSLSLSSLLLLSPCFAQTTTVQKDPGHVMLTPDQIVWQAVPPSLPPGAQIAALDGDPAKAGVP
jgi:hypothetical protein